jgi:hypothetical protein
VSTEISVVEFFAGRRKEGLLVEANANRKTKESTWSSHEIIPVKA